jgi:hypothetical protein
VTMTICMRGHHFLFLGMTLSSNPQLSLHLPRYTALLQQSLPPTNCLSFKNIRMILLYLIPKSILWSLRLPPVLPRLGLSNALDRLPLIKQISTTAFLSNENFKKQSLQFFLRKLVAHVFPPRFPNVRIVSSTNNTPTPQSTTNDQSASSYRMIKTPSTFLAERKIRQQHEDEADLDLDERPIKMPRIKSNHDTSSASRHRRNFATGPASLRRAASLRSDAESEVDDDDEVRSSILLSTFLVQNLNLIGQDTCASGHQPRTYRSLDTLYLPSRTIPNQPCSPS